MIGVLSARIRARSTLYRREGKERCSGALYGCVVVAVASRGREERAKNASQFGMP